MNDTDFAQFLSTFIDPFAVVESAKRYTASPRKACAPAELVIGSSYLLHGDEGHYAELVRKFLRGFRVPGSVMSHQLAALHELN